MNFFENQEAARRSSRELIALFVLAVIAIVAAVNAALAAMYFGALAPHGTWARYGFSALPNYFFETTTAVVLIMIVGGTVQQILELRAGGEAVAQMVGARLVDPATRDPLERRLLNVIEEMSLASGIPAPRAYVLDGESGINAFAAGLHTADAIVAVTHGALTRLNRDELQGVMGHEFSHILNGDIGLNVRLIGVLQGLLLLALFGRFLIAIASPRGRPRDSASGPLFVVGLTVLAIGYIGVFFGRLIKASVSRQREFLADASSVQFTRNPDGIGGALRKIGGLGADAGGAVQHLHAETLSHMFMAPVSLSLASGLLASHPPLRERLRRIFGRAVDYLPADELPVQPEPPQPPMRYEAVTPPSAAAELLSPLSAAVSATASTGATAAALHASIGKATAGTVSFGANLSARLDGLGLRTALADATQAQLLVLSMLLDGQAQIRTQQLAAAAEYFGSNAGPQIEQFAGIIGGLAPGWRLPLLDLSMPALRTLSPAQREALLRLAQQLIVADGRVTLAEFLLFSVLKRRLGPPVAINGPGRALHLNEVSAEASLVMSLIACVRLPQDAQRAFDAGKALLPAAGSRVAQHELALAQISAAFDRLALLAPLEKPLLIKACVAIAFIDGSSHWKAASCLRTLCAALDCPLPPQVEASE